MVPTLALSLTERARRQSALADGLLIVGGALLVAVLAQVRVPLPFTPVPITGQTLGVLLAGAALGARRGTASLLLYAAAGTLGLPVFTGGGAGAAWLAGPTGGYLAGFVVAAYVIGRLAERGLDRRWRTALIPFLAGEGVIFVCGVLWLALFVGADRALQAGLWPFVPGEALKIVLAGAMLPAAWRVVKE